MGKIAIHKRESSYSDHWIEYCVKHNIEFKIVDCYKNDIVDQLHDCDALMWHYNQLIPEDILFAKQLLYSVESTGRYVFPNFNTMWHFDDKIGQKYLLESINTSLVPSYVFYSKKEALDWVQISKFPKVFKLRVGASSHNVQLVRTKAEARHLVNQAFGSGFRPFSPLKHLKECVRLYKSGETKVLDLAKATIRLVYQSDYVKFSSNEKNYIYFQDFIPNNASDTRIVVVDNKAFGAKRLVRKNDFRASGSHTALYEKELIDKETLNIAFVVTQKLKLQCVAFDFVYDNGKPLIVEISYGTSVEAYKPCPGYWDSNLNFHEGEFNFCGWMVDKVVSETNNKQN